LLVTPQVTLPVGIAFYLPDPALTAWKKEDEQLKMSPTPFYNEGMALGVWIRHPTILESEETTEAELYAFARKALKELGAVQVKVAVGKPAEEILRVAREERVDLIVMGTHGRTGLRQLLLGSVTEPVARYAPCLVFTV
jgi:nucleotide-binding universal stress UspA family protein